MNSRNEGSVLYYHVCIFLYVVKLIPQWSLEKKIPRGKPKCLPHSVCSSNSMSTCCL